MGNIQYLKSNFEKELQEWIVSPSDLDDWKEGAESFLPGQAISTGSQGTVYKARFAGHPVAVKQFHSTTIKGGAFDANIELPEAALAEFITEVRAMHILHHPSCVALYGVSLKPCIFFVAEYCPCSLGAVLFKKGEAEAYTGVHFMRWAMQIAKGLQYLHSKGVVHRDLKPENVLLSSVRLEEAHAKLCDFGIARFLNQGAKSRAKGSPHFMAPELHKDKVVDKAKLPSTDVYAFGILLWVMYTRCKPYFDSDHNLSYILSNKLRPKLPAHCPKSLESLAKRCWNEDPSIRPTSAQLCKDLKKISEEFQGGERLDLPDMNSIKVRTAFQTFARAALVSTTLRGFSPLSSTKKKDNTKPLSSKEFKERLKNTMATPLDKLKTVHVCGLSDRKFKADIPAVLLNLWDRLVMCGGLQTVGIFRIAPEETVFGAIESQLKLVTSLEDHRQCVSKINDPHCLARLVKHFFRDVPASIFRNVDKKDLQKMVHNQIDDRKQLVGLLQMYLSPEQYVLVSWLLDALNVVVQTRNNRMGVNAISRTWALSVDFSRNSTEQSNLELLEDMAHMLIVTDFLILLLRAKAKQDRRRQSFIGKMRTRSQTEVVTSSWSAQKPCTMAQCSIPRIPGEMFCRMHSVKTTDDQKLRSGEDSASEDSARVNLVPLGATLDGSMQILDALLEVVTLDNFENQEARFKCVKKWTRVLEDEDIHTVQELRDLPLFLWSDIATFSNIGKLLRQVLEEIRGERHQILPPPPQHC